MIKKKAAAKVALKGTDATAGRSAETPGVKDPTLQLVRELARIATEFDLAEIEVKAPGRVRVSRRMAAAPSAAPMAAAPAPAAAPSPAGLATAARAVEDDGVYVTSPFVGTFYRAPSPDAPSFVDVGASVRKGQVVCIIEAMKLMNEIESDVEGKVLEVLVKNAEHVEYGQKLFRLQKA